MDQHVTLDSHLTAVRVKFCKAIALECVMRATGKQGGYAKDGRWHCRSVTIPGTDDYIVVSAVSASSSTYVTVTRRDRYGEVIGSIASREFRLYESIASIAADMTHWVKLAIERPLTEQEVAA